jgi:protease-4
MLYLQKEHPKVPIYAVCTDVCASGGYYIALGAKNIYVNKMTITGSIGVVGSGFGFTGLIDKLGIERRTYTSGANKNFLDPFSPQVPAQAKEFEKILQDTHQVFIDAVVASRGDRLKDKSLSSTFSGEPFGGIQAKKIGLVDGFMSANDVRKQKYNNIPFVDYTQPLDVFSKISNKIGGSIYYKALSQANILLY